MKKRFNDIAFELVIGLCALSLIGVNRSPGVGSWQEECIREGCETEELEEIYNSYYSECIDETCSTEEIRELSGSPGDNENMLFDFLQQQWVIQSGNISSTRPPDNAAWLFTGASATGLLYQVWEPVNQSVSNLANVHDVNFTDRVSSFRVGEDAYVATYNDASFSGAQLVVATDQASLGSPFDNAISSVRVNLVTNPFVGSDTMSVDQAVQNIEDHVGVPASTTIQASRSNVGLSGSFVVHLDVGGEGPTSGCGLVTGWRQAMNLNDKTQTTTCPPSADIPNLIRLNDWSTNPPYPFADGFADYITMQGAPLTETNVSQIARTLRSGGSVALWIDREAFQDQIDNLATLLNATPEYNVYDEFGGMAGLPKILIVQGSAP